MCVCLCASAYDTMLIKQSLARDSSNTSVPIFTFSRHTPSLCRTLRGMKENSVVEKCQAPRENLPARLQDKIRHQHTICLPAGHAHIHFSSKEKLRVLQESWEKVGQKKKNTLQHDFPSSRGNSKGLLRYDLLNPVDLQILIQLLGVRGDQHRLTLCS